MATMTLGRKALGQARDVGETIAAKAGDARATIAPKAREMKAAIAPNARRLGAAMAPKADQLGRAFGARTKETRRKVGYWIAGETPRTPRRWPALVATGVGALVAFFLDPVSGKRRRAVTKDWVAARFRAVGRRGARLGRGVGAYAGGYRRRIEHAGRERQPENDATLAHKVESELFQGRGIDAPDTRININAEDGVVYLRGAVEQPQQVSEIERRVRDIFGVRGVVNLLHLQGTPAPSS